MVPFCNWISWRLFKILYNTYHHEVLELSCSWMHCEGLPSHDGGPCEHHHGKNVEKIAGLLVEAIRKLVGLRRCQGKPLLNGSIDCCLIVFTLTCFLLPLLRSQWSRLILGVMNTSRTRSTDSRWCEDRHWKYRKQGYVGEKKYISTVKGYNKVLESTQSPKKGNTRPRAQRKKKWPVERSAQGKKIIWTNLFARHVTEYKSKCYWPVNG